MVYYDPLQNAFSSEWQQQMYNQPYPNYVEPRVVRTDLC